ncbi:extracellular solute-binding protein [Fibrobacter sp.]|uniref:extracellular solute-binding protein n=1 Tax=Fibrobacter sp. TaxID=35828 RepID=UPI0026075A16|nr:extracellular solute-binding protein [Fibrobacter sp.]MDD7497484.1 extracellular solute-binding protein [Fibrobacter sp.]MDY5725394.1 extracellular solute-binding protein [Fibrobacter sp.]
MLGRVYGIALFVITLALAGVVPAFAVPELRAAAPPPDTLVLWVMDQDINTGTALQKLMRKYTQQSGIPVKIRFLDWGAAFAELNKVLATEAGSGTDYPDVLQLGSTWVPYFAKAGLISPLTEMLDAVDTSRFYPEMMKASHIGRDTVVYSIPWFLDVRGFFANERIWLELGLHDSEIETYPQFFGVLRAIAEAKVQNRAGGLVVPFEFGVKDDWTGYQQMSPFLWNFGGDFVAETENGYRSALADSSTLVGLRVYLKLLRDQDVSPHNLHENSSSAADRFVRSEQLLIFGTPELIRKIEFDSDIGGLKESPIAKDGLISVSAPGGPVGNFTFVGGSHLVLPKNGNLSKRKTANDLFLFMVRADNIDYYSRQSGFIPSDESLIRIWMQDSRYSHLVTGLEHNGRSCQNIPEWSEIEMLVNAMVNSVARNIAQGDSGVDDATAQLVLETHERINSLFGYEDADRAAVRKRIRDALMQPVEEKKYDKGINFVGNSSGFSPRLIVVVSLGAVAVVLLLIFIIRFRKR